MKKAFNKFASSCVLILSTHAFANTNNITIPISLSQNAFSYTHQNIRKSLVSKKDHKKNIHYFQKQYFQPWAKSNKQKEFCYVPGIESTCQSVKNLEVGTLDYYKGKSGFNEHYLPHSQNWLTPIKQNMDLESFPNLSCVNTSSCKGIMVKNAEVRSLPTDKPFYLNYDSPGEGFPFDYIQLSDMWLGTPVQLIQQTKDKKWILIKGQGILGWVHANSVAAVSEKFIQRWENKRFVTPSAYKQEIHLKKADLNLSLQIGSLLPLAKNNKILVPYKGKNEFAKIDHVSAANIALSLWPLKANEYNFAKQINALSGMPYGWGGKDFHNDCSGMIRRLFIAFGIWLPRASTWQTNYSGKKYSLYDKTSSQRKDILIKRDDRNYKPKPFLTLISFGNSKNSTSHIALYLGTKLLNHKKIAVMFNSLWGIPIHNQNESGRALVAQSVISPVGVGESISAGFKEKDWDVDSLWNTKNMNLINISKSMPETKGVYDLDLLSTQEKVKEYILHQ